MSSLAVFLILGGATAFAAVKKVGANEIKANSIKTGKILKEAVTAGKIKKSAITESRIADGAVTNSKIADNAVSTSKIADNAVTTSKVANGAINGSKIGAGAVSRANLSEGNLLPRGYAFVDSDGNVLPAFTSGIPNGTNPAAGVFCFTVSFSPVSAQATVEADGDSNDFASVDLAGVNGAISGCPAGSNVKVEVEDAASGNTDEEFFLTLW
jgi:hypothetical protein